MTEFAGRKDYGSLASGGRRIFRLEEDLVEDDSKWPWAVSYVVRWPFRENSINSDRTFTQLHDSERKSSYFPENNLSK